MLQVELLSRLHDRNGFDCGESELNDYLLRTARQHVEKGVSRTFVLVDSGQPEKILAFFTLTACEVVTSGLPANLARKYPARAPAAKLARLAVSSDQQRRGLGGVMMVEAMKRTLAVAENIGIIGFFVDAKNPRAVEYYRQFGYIDLPSTPLELFLPLDSLRPALAAAEEES